MSNKEFLKAADIWFRQMCQDGDDIFPPPPYYRNCFEQLPGDQVLVIQIGPYCRKEIGCFVPSPRPLWKI